MAQGQESALGRSLPLHGFGPGAADSLERKRQASAGALEADPTGLIFCLRLAPKAGPSGVARRCRSPAAWGRWLISAVGIRP